MWCKTMNWYILNSLMKSLFIVRSGIRTETPHSCWTKTYNYHKISILEEEKNRLSLVVCAVQLIHLTLKHRSNTLLSLVNGSPRTTAFIIEILSCQVTLHTCQEGLKGTAPAPLLCCSAWFFIALHSSAIHCCFQPYVNIIHFRMWQVLTVRHCGATSSQNHVYTTKG